MRFSFFSFLGMLVVCGTGIVQADTAEIMHFWVSDGERHALNVFRDEFIDDGDAWLDETRSSFQDLRDAAISRLADGFPPTAIQLIAGYRIDALTASGVITPLDEITNVDEYRNTLHPAVRDIILRDGQMSVIPVGLHGNNWAWYSSKIYRDLDLEIPNDWYEFIRQAPTIRAAGYTPLAIGNNSWEMELLINTIFIDVGGADLYTKILSGRNITDADLPLIKEAFNIFAELRTIAAEDSNTFDSWDQATSAIIENRAAMQIMGDWAKGEFHAAGKTYGDDFICRIAPGNHQSYVVTIDVFALTSGTSVSEQEMQAKLVHIMLNPELQLEFSKRKGSLPVINTVEMSQADPCAQIGWDALIRSENQLYAPLQTHKWDGVTLLPGIVRNFWNDTNMSSDMALDYILSQISQE